MQTLHGQEASVMLLQFPEYGTCSAQAELSRGWLPSNVTPHEDDGDFTSALHGAETAALG